MKAVTVITCSRCKKVTEKIYKSVILARVDLINITKCPNCEADTRYLTFEIKRREN